MKRFKLLVCCALGAGFLLSSCDSGDIIPQEDKGKNEIQAEFVFHQVRTIPTVRERKLAFMSYADKENSKPNRIHVITSAEEGEAFQISLTQVPDQTRKAVLALVDQDNQVIFPFWEKEIGWNGHQADLGRIEINLATFERLQHQLFNQSCLDCHSGGNLSAGLNLAEGQSFRGIVGVESKIPGMPIVKPGDAEGSLMVKQLTDYSIGTFHTTLTTMKENDIELLKTWIQAGAPKE